MARASHYCDDLAGSDLKARRRHEYRTKTWTREPWRRGRGRCGSGQRGFPALSCTFWTGHTLHTHRPVGDETKGHENRREEIRSGVRAGYRGAFEVPSGPFDTQHPHASRLREVGVEHS